MAFQYVTGLDEIEKRLDALPGELVALSFVQAFSAVDNIIQAELAATEPHGPKTADITPTLAESRTSVITLDSKLRGGILNIGYGKQGYIARFVEYGHALIGHKPNSKILGSITPRPFMLRAFDASAERAVAAFANVLSRQLK